VPSPPTGAAPELSGLSFLSDDRDERIEDLQRQLQRAEAERAVARDFSGGTFFSLSLSLSMYIYIKYIRMYNTHILYIILLVHLHILHLHIFTSYICTSCVFTSYICTSYVFLLLLLFWTTCGSQALYPDALALLPAGVGYYIATHLEKIDFG
jgi:hypothetical protein